MMKGTVDSIKKLCDEAKMVNKFCYLEGRLSTNAGCSHSKRIGWVRLEKVVLDNWFPLKIKVMVVA